MPESASVVGVFSFGQLFAEHHLLAVAEQMRVVRHPRDRLAVANSHVRVVFQPRVGPLQQLASIVVKHTTDDGFHNGRATSSTQLESPHSRSHRPIYQHFQPTVVTVRLFLAVVCPPRFSPGFY